MATTIVNARVFDGESMRPWTSVRFEDGVITHGTEQPAVLRGDEVVDADGGTLLPGLIDAHIHLVPGALEQSLTFGVTTGLDMFSKPDTVAGSSAVREPRRGSHLHPSESASGPPDSAWTRLGRYADWPAAPLSRR